MDLYALACVTVLSTISSAFLPATALSPALILTPYLENNQTEEARKLSTVNPAVFLNITSHSGFLTVNKTHNSNTFFWYFPVQKKAVNETPWIIWLQGGPGGSSLVGLFDEMGPFQYDAGISGLKLREWSWCKEYSMVFIDNPVGTGYSFTQSEEGFARNMTQYTTDLHTAVLQLVALFPELSAAPLYIAGESYAGLFVPALASRIMEDKAQVAVNLQGIILGNPLINHAYQSNYSQLYHEWGLLDTQGVLAAKELQDAYTLAVASGNATGAYQLHDKLFGKIQLISAQIQTYNVLVDNYEHLGDFATFLRQEDVKEAIHVGDTPFQILNDFVSRRLSEDFLSSTDEKIERLLEHYRVLIYCGQLDLTLPCSGAEAARRDWRWAHAAEFLKAPRVPWSGDNDTVAGYVKSGGGLTEVLVRGAGHLVPIDEPKQTWTLVSYFIRGIDLPVLPNYQILPGYTPIPKPSEISNKTKEGSIPQGGNIPQDGNVSQNSSIPQGGNVPQNGSVPQGGSTPQDTSVPQDKNQDTSMLPGSGMVVSIVLNVILVLVIIVGVIIYIRMRRKYEAFYYSTVDNLSDDIFLS